MCDGVASPVTCRAEYAVSAESEAVIGRRRRVAIVTAGVRERAQPVSAEEADRWFGNNSRHLGGRVDQTTSAGGLGWTPFNLRRHHLYQ